MSYKKQNFNAGDVLKAAQLNAMDEQILANEIALEGKQERGDYLTEQKLKTINGQSLVGDGDIVIGGENPNSYNTVYTFSDAIMGWANGEKFPIAFIGDSTFYGTNTSGDDYTFCDKLQSLLREEFGTNATIYRVAKAGAKLDYGITNFDSWFGKSGTYADTKMVGIGFGINDRLLHTNYKSYFTDVYSKVETLVQKCFEVGKQPFIVTSQATTECGVRTDYTVDYPIRTAGAMDMCANNAKKEVAKKYNIPLIDYNDFSEKYLLYSTIGVDTIISDQLHFGNNGHAWAGGFFFSQINSRVIHIKGKNRQIVTYANQSIESAVPQDKISYGGDYKLYTKYTKSDSSNLKIMDFYIFAEDTQCDIYAYKNDSGSTYVSIDGVTTTLSSGETQLEQLEMGLHHIEVYTGESTAVDFIGFDINPVKSAVPTLTRLAMPLVSISDTGLAEWGVIENASGYKYKINGGTEQFTDNTSVQLEFGQSIIVKAIGDSVTYQDSLYSDKVSFGTTIEVDNFNLTPYRTFAQGIYPCVFATGYNGTTKTTAFSGATIKSFIVKSSNDGTLTFGVVDVNSYANGKTPTVSKTKQVSVKAGDNTIDLSDLEIGAHETLTIGTPGDTALPHYNTSIELKGKNLFLLTPTAWADGGMEQIEIQFIAKMTYIIP